ncbi:MAG: ABC transporter permease [Limnochordia bacterium]|jgi:putative ABC transport system permease protein
MRILLRIAWRNLRKQKIKTLIVGIIMVVGIVVLVVGNSLMDSATAGIERSYTRNYTGHLIITGKHPGRLTLFGFQDLTAMERSVPHIPDYQEVLEYVRSLPYVEGVNPQITAGALVGMGDETLGVTQLFGIDPVQYRNMFPENIELLAGDFFQPGEEGVLLSQRLVERIESRQGITIQPGDKILLTGVSVQTGMRIREVPVSGIFRFLQSNPQLDMVSLLDADNARDLAGLVVGHTDAAELTEREQAFLGELDIDSLFTGLDSLFEESSSEQVLNIEDLFVTLEPEPAPASDYQEDTGAWHFLIIRLTDERYLGRAQADLAAFFEQQGIPAQTSNWLQGAGVTAELGYGIKNIFNGIVAVIAVVAVIIIMNTLVISVTERTAEIGTMRAIGAQKSFVWKMVLCETLLLTGIAGAVGLSIGGAILAALNVVGIEASNMFFEIIFGGPVLRPELSLSSVVMALAVVFVVGVVASSYPASIVMKMPPVKAMQSE